MPEIPQGILVFDRFALDPMRGCVRAGEEDIDLPPKPFEVLCHLVQNAGRLVSKQELHDAVWREVAVTDDSVVQCIGELRRQLGDTDHRLIKTVARRGYMLDATVAPLAAPALEPALPSLPDEDASRNSPPVARSTLLATLSRVARGRAGAATTAFGVLVLAYLVHRAGAPGLGGTENQVAVAAAATAPGPQHAAFKDCDGCPDMVVLPAGTFLMGAPKDDRDRKQAEGLPRRVVIPKPFAIGRFEVTVGQFSAFVAKTGVRVESTCRLFVKLVPMELGPPEASFRRPGFEVTSQHPVSCVNWHYAQAYVAWLGRRTGRPYRLPTEAEWEYAARAGTTTNFSFGNDETQLCIYGRFADLGTAFAGRSACRSDITTYGSIPVGKLKPNPWGLYDMHGNVWEWVADCWTSNPSEIPTDGSAFVRPGNCEQGVIRGGSYAAGYHRLRSAFRYPLLTTATAENNGFRVALSLGEER